MKEPQFSPLTVLRLAAPDAPSLRELARVIGRSPTLISRFELGRAMLAKADVALYAKAVGRTTAEVTARWEQAALAYHLSMVRSLRKGGRDATGKLKTGRKPGGLARQR